MIISLFFYRCLFPCNSIMFHCYELMLFLATIIFLLPKIQKHTVSIIVNSNYNMLLVNPLLQKLFSLWEGHFNPSSEVDFSPCYWKPELNSSCLSVRSHKQNWFYISKLLQLVCKTFWDSSPTLGSSTSFVAMKHIRRSVLKVQGVENKWMQYSWWWCFIVMIKWII